MSRFTRFKAHYRWDFLFPHPASVSSKCKVHLVQQTMNHLPCFVDWNLMTLVHHHGNAILQLEVYTSM